MEKPDGTRTLLSLVCSSHCYVIHNKCCLGVDHLTFDRGGGRFEKKISCKAFTVKNYLHHWPVRKKFLH